jgi:uncharacterized protein (DUF2062 family)
VITFFRKYKNKAILSIRKLLSLRASPHQIAIGFAIGVFVGIFPTFGFGAIVILAIASLWKFNIPAAIIGTVMGNPLFAPIWITLTCVISGIKPSEIKLPNESINQILAHYGNIGLRFIIGNMGVSIVVAGISYFLVNRAVSWYKKKNIQKIEKNVRISEKNDKQSN